MSGHTILVGDAGGTNVRFALARISDGRVTLSDIWKRPGADFATFESALDAWRHDTKPEFAGASFGLAGQVVEGRVDLLNRGWTVDLDAVRARLELESIVAVNDFHAMARSAPGLGAHDTREIAPGRADPSGSLAIGGPGTGFGIAVLRRFTGRQDGWVVVGGEGGHQTFAPQTGLEWKLAEQMRKSTPDVSNELVAAGAGFDLTLDALFAVMGAAPRRLSPAEVIEEAKAGDAVCLAFCRIRAACVMTAMGNLALASAATGGVFIAGGVSVRLEPWLREKAALDRFYSRGPRTPMLRPIPTRLVTSEAAPLIGSALLWLDERSRGWL